MDDASTATHPDDASPSAAPTELEDEEIFCPVCRYNLTGNMTGRCSECGGLFSRRQLIEATRISVDALMPWERDDEFEFRERFWRTLRISFFRPKEFALAFAAQPTRSKSTSFYVLCLILIAIGTVPLSGIGILASTHKSDAAIFLLLPLFLVVPILPVNIAVGLFYTIRFRQPDGRRRLRPWRSIVEYATPHWLLGCVAPVPTILFGLVNWEYLWLLLLACTMSFWIGCSILWAFTLKHVVRWRTWMVDPPRDVMVSTLLVAWAVWIGVSLLLGVLVEEFDELVGLVEYLIRLLWVGM